MTERNSEVSNATTERLRIKFLGAILILLVLGGIIAFVWKPEYAKDTWLMIGPIVSGGFVYLAGQNAKTSKP